MELNSIDITLLTFTIITSILGVWINYFRKFTPPVVYKAVLYGHMIYKSPKTEYLSRIEIPKAYFRYFYTYAYIFSLSSLVYMITAYFFHVSVDKNVHFILNMFMKEQQPVSVIAALITMTLLTIHCARRLHETLYLQVFSRNGKMNVVHFSLAILHYTICIAAIIGVSPLFCGTQNREEILWTDMTSPIGALLCIVIFVWASYEQRQTNMILANLRKHQESGVVITEEYRVPFGKLFNFVSNPHRLTEIVIYLSLALIMRTKTWFLILVWVTSNQLQASIASHTWYKKTFSTYPTQRYALIPGVI